ncbi:MAG: glycosyltransferase family 61 protein, partial [Verrucomicrobiota bacterium]
WISRRDVQKRRLLNDDKLIAQITAHMGKPRVLELGNHSLVEQAKALAEAKVVFAEQGQSLNLLPMLKDKTVVMFDAGSYRIIQEWNEAFFVTGTIAGNRMVRLFSGTLPDKDSNWTHSVETFEHELKAITAWLPH